MAASLSSKPLPTELEAQKSLENINAMGQILLAMPLGDRLGVACAILLDAAFNHRTEFRRVMLERVHREGFSGISLLRVFQRQSE